MPSFEFLPDNFENRLIWVWSINFVHRPSLLMYNSTSFFIRSRSSVLQMSWRQATHLFGPSPSDRVMMEEVLELLAMDSPLGDDRTGSTTASSKSNDNDMDNNPSSLTGINHSSANDTTQDDGGGIASSDISQAIETSCPNNDCDGQQQEEEEQSHPVPAAEEVRGDGPQMPISSSMYATTYTGVLCANSAFLMPDGADLAPI